MRPVFIAVLLAVGMTTVFEALAQRSGSHQLFGVREGIELNYFANELSHEGDGVTLVSPDGKRVVFVTSHGLLRDNMVESTIWLATSEKIEDCLRSSVRPVCSASIHPLITMKAIPRRKSYEPHGPVVYNLKWSSDGRRLYFLAEQPHNVSALFKVNADTGAVVRLSRPAQDVKHYDVQQKSVVFDAPDLDTPLNLSEASKPRFVTGLALNDILFPQSYTAFGSDLHTPRLWMLPAQGTPNFPRRLATQEISDKEHDTDVFSLSPSATSLIRVIPVTSVPFSWSRYKPVPGHEDRAIDPGNSDTVAASNRWRLRIYAITNLITGKTTPLLGSPIGDSLGDVDAISASWSADGRHALITNVTLPLAEGKESTICAAAILDVPSLTSTCLASSRYRAAGARTSTTSYRLLSATFSQSENAALLIFASPSGTDMERFVFANGRWSLRTEDPVEPSRTGVRSTGVPFRRQLHLSLKQDLNHPPTLWAYDDQNRKGIEVWNPNPSWKSSDFAAAQSVEWKDVSGYRWAGILIRPVDYRPDHHYPLIIQTHGSDADHFLIDGKYPTAEAARALSSAGFFVLQMGYRADHISSPAEASDQLKGYESAVEFLSTMYPINPQKVGIVGFSRTGFHVEEALIHNPDLFAAAVIADGTDSSYMPYRLFGYRDTFVSNDIERLIGAKPYANGLQVWMERASGFHLDQIKAPILVEALGASSLLMEWELFSGRQQVAGNNQLLYIPDGQHVLQKPQELYRSQIEMVEWFRRWLRS